jgi:glycerol-3-phosphate dehydrogenase
MTPSRQSMDRARALRALADQTFDLLVIGGGITGAGVAREASLRGFKVALVEQADFASGTSSRSTKLVHGGLRYLKQFWSCTTCSLAGRPMSRTAC